MSGHSSSLREGLVSPRLRKTAALARDSAVAAAAFIATGLHLAAGRWLEGVLALVAGGLWIALERGLLPVREGSKAGLVHAAFVAIGILLVWRFNEARMWLIVAGMWLLVCAADLSRLVRRYPVDSSAADQRMLLNRRIQHLALLGAASAAGTVLTRVLVLRLRLVAVALLATFVVIVFLRTVRSLRDGADGSAAPPGDEAESGS